MNRTAESRVSRRRPRFALLTLLVLVTAIAVALGLFTPEWHRGHRKRQVAGEVQRLGGHVTFGLPQEATGVISGWLHLVLGDEYFAEAIYVSLTPRSEEDIELLRAFPELPSLRLTGPGVTDSALERLPGLAHSVACNSRARPLANEACNHSRNCRICITFPSRTARSSMATVHGLCSGSPNCRNCSRSSSKRCGRRMTCRRPCTALGRWWICTSITSISPRPRSWRCGMQILLLAFTLVDGPLTSAQREFRRLLSQCAGIATGQGVCLQGPRTSDATLPF